MSGPAGPGIRRLLGVLAGDGPAGTAIGRVAGADSMNRLMSDPTSRPPRRPSAAETKRREEETDDAALKALRSRLSGVLRRLPEIERRVLELRMGLVDGVPAKPGQVAERLGLTIAEVKKIEVRAFERIRQVGPIQGLEKFLAR